MIKVPPEVKVSEWYPTYGFTQKHLRYLYVDCDVRIFEDQTDGVIYQIMDSGPVDKRRRDLSGYWLRKLEDYL